MQIGISLLPHRSGEVPAKRGIGLSLPAAYRKPTERGCPSVAYGASSPGPTGPFSLKTVHRTVFRVLEPIEMGSLLERYLSFCRFSQCL